MSKIQRISEQLDYLLSENTLDEGILDILKPKKKFKYRYLDYRLGKYIYGEKKSINNKTAEKEIMQTLDDKGRKFDKLEVIDIDSEFTQEPKVYSLYKAPSQVKKEMQKTTSISFGSR